MKTKAERKESYLCPEVTLTRVILEESMVAIQSPVNGITLTSEPSDRLRASETISNNTLVMIVAYKNGTYEFSAMY